MRCTVECTPVKVVQLFCWSMTPFNHLILPYEAMITHTLQYSWGILLIPKATTNWIIVPHPPPACLLKRIFDDIIACLVCILWTWAILEKERFVTLYQASGSPSWKFRIPKPPFIDYVSHCYSGDGCTCLLLPSFLLATMDSLHA